MTRYFCDRCKNESIWDGLRRVTIFCGLHGQSSVQREAEICKSCYYALESFLNGKEPEAS